MMNRMASFGGFLFLGCALVGCIPAAPAQPAAQVAAAPATCPAGSAELTLPPGFCATVFADSLPAPRHMVVLPTGDLVVALRAPEGRGGLMALRDTNGDGRADVQTRLAAGFSATGIGVHDGFLYTESGAAIFRYRIEGGNSLIGSAADTIVRELPIRGHAAKTFAISPAGRMYVNVGSLSNACQERDRQAGSAGVDPCTELDTRAGIWTFDAARRNQMQSDGRRYATGIRNAVAIRLHPADGALWVVQHGRDQLAQNWGDRFTEEQNAELPAEELFRVTEGADFGWPYCYFDGRTGRRVLAPEYGGDGRSEGRCAGTAPPVAALPAHWAPNDMLFYRGSQFPERYRNGTFIAFHGSWNRHPLPQQGFNVVFQPLRANAAGGPFEVFADGFFSAPARMQPRAPRTPGSPEYRPTGLAEGPDGSLYISDDHSGRIWKVRYLGAR
jgi:glucose/arabinose dehydrogenase